VLGAAHRVERLARQVSEQALVHDGLLSPERALALLQAAWAVGFVPSSDGPSERK
jgi:hypothetical protein